MGVEISVEVVGKLNFAQHQCSIPVLQELTVSAPEDSPLLEDVELRLTSDPVFLKPKIWKIAKVGQGQTLGIKDRKVDLSGQFLLDLKERVAGSLKFELVKNEEVIAARIVPIELLARNEWGGTSAMPELLPAFCLPNDPAIDKILNEASRVLSASGKSDAIDGYRSGSRSRVWEITSAIYAAIANRHISYAVPPASFERVGQKVRLPGQILENKVGTCLDTSLLFAAALEQAGLNSIIVMPEGHALVGVWLQPEDFSAVLLDEAEPLRKRVQLNELLLVETTLATGASPNTFRQAVSKGAESVALENDQSFVAAVDVRRARGHGISPIGLIESTAKVEDVSDEISSELGLDAPPQLPDFDGEVEADEAPATASGRIDRWQRKLLDLSVRNPLLNHKAKKASLNLICPEPGLLEDKLAAGRKISLKEMPNVVEGQQDDMLHEQATGSRLKETYAFEALERDQVLVALEKDELSKRAVDLYRKTQTDLQEGGTNTLYLALGFLLWKKSENDDRRFRAPLILLPVSLERKSVRSGVKLMAHDDEPRFNPTLLEMLERDHGLQIPALFGDLPTDDSGIDVDGIWNIVRQAVKDVPGFEVSQEVVLGHFSFAKYLMWKDLVDRTDQLRINPVVAHLIDTPRDLYSSLISFVAEPEIDRKYRPGELLAPLSADASQLAAIATAEKGKDFVLVGPPGTGKSQTIANLIFHFLGNGKSVLFVSEKTAALNVVHKRLVQLGIGDYCLPLHSNKAKKSDVLAQLGRAWSSLSQNLEEDWGKSERQLGLLRDEINSFVDVIHKPGKNGLTPFNAIGKKILDPELAGLVKLRWPTANQHSAEDFAKMLEAVKKLSVQATAIGDVSGSPFNVVNVDDWSPQWEREIVEKAERLLARSSDIEAARDRAIEALTLDLTAETPEALTALGQLASALISAHGLEVGFASSPSGNDMIAALEECVSALKLYADSLTQLSCPYEPESWRNVNGADIKDEWEVALGLGWPKSFFAKRKVVKQLKMAGAKGKPDPSVDGQVLADLKAQGTVVDKLEAKLGGLGVWEKFETPPEKLTNLREVAALVRRSTASLFGNMDSLLEARARIGRLLSDGNEFLASDSQIGLSLSNYLEALRAYEKALADFLAVSRSGDSKHALDKTSKLDTIEEIVSEIVSRKADLRAWCAWVARRNDAIRLDLKSLVDAVTSGDIGPDAIERAFNAGYCAWWSEAIIGETTILRKFSSVEHCDVIERFKKADDEFQKLTARYVREKLAGNLPSQDDVTRNSQWGLLRRELQKKTRHKPVRQLVQEVPEVISTLAPCLMMSPLSVAQYLPTDKNLFDLVIFDEASQITVWDSIGAIARGKQVVVAGDPKQMPPTNFFNRSEEDADADVDIDGDLESILDEMLGASIPEHRLNLHYRSRNESLITFSNRKYYDGRLVTFPAPSVLEKGVSLVRPEGYYARGHGRHNRGEAEAIVTEIVRRLKDPILKEMSIGVVTFNSEQQNLIENLLDNARSSNPEIEWAFAADLEEPVFVKNLETVQGDERDIILFSITYGPDDSGHMTMNFGPLNRQGGERRLNVALTRARSEMIVFSTLRPEQMDVSRTSGIAVADLKTFLKFAENGIDALAGEVVGSLGDYDSPFEEAVAIALQDKGWRTVPQVGASSYRIDIGIVDPDNPGEFLAGVECDGAMYHSSAVARERDKIREQVLNGLGWSLVRIWSTDWWNNKAKAAEETHNRLIEILESKRASRTEAVSTETRKK